MQPHPRLRPSATRQLLLSLSGTCRGRRSHCGVVDALASAPACGALVSLLCSCLGASAGFCWRVSKPRRYQSDAHLLSSGTCCGWCCCCRRPSLFFLLPTLVSAPSSAGTITRKKKPCLLHCAEHIIEGATCSTRCARHETVWWFCPTRKPEIAPPSPAAIQIGKRLSRA
jgi:hypothetical protein